MSHQIVLDHSVKKEDMAAARRLFGEYKTMTSEFQDGIFASPTEDILVWDAVIFGEEGTLYEGGCFNLTMDFPLNYPNDPPSIRFVSQLFHPNIYQDGSICLDILGNRWSPTFDIKIALCAVRSLLTQPNAQSPANSNAATLLLKDEQEYNRRVLQCVRRTWDEEEPNNFLDEDEEYQAWLEEYTFMDQVDDLGLRHLFQQTHHPDVIGRVSTFEMFEECTCPMKLIICGFCGHHWYDRVQEDCKVHHEEDVDVRCYDCQQGQFISQHSIPPRRN